MKTMKHSLLLILSIVFCGQFLSSCSSAKMTQSKVADYQKSIENTAQSADVQITAVKEVNSTSMNNTAIVESTQVFEEEILEANTNRGVLVNMSDIVASSDEVIILEDTPVFTASTSTEEPVILSPSMEQAQEKMEILVTNPSLSKKEKRAMKKEVRQTVMKELKTQKKAMKAAKKSGLETADDDKVIRIILAFFIPPLSVALGRGIGSTFWLNLLLTLIFFLPGLIHALIVVGEDY